MEVWESLRSCWLDIADMEALFSRCFHGAQRAVEIGLTATTSTSSTVSQRRRHSRRAVLYYKWKSVPFTQGMDVRMF